MYDMSAACITTSRVLERDHPFNAYVVYHYVRVLKFFLYNDRNSIGEVLKYQQLMKGYSKSFVCELYFACFIFRIS